MIQHMWHMKMSRDRIIPVNYTQKYKGAKTTLEEEERFLEKCGEVLESPASRIYAYFTAL